MHTPLPRYSKLEHGRFAQLQQSPPRIVVWFDQELDASASTIGVFSAQGDADRAASRAADHFTGEAASSLFSRSLAGRILMSVIALTSVVSNRASAE